MTNPGQEQQAAIPVGAAEILRVFMQFSAPLALVSQEGEIVLANPALSARYGAASLVPESLRNAVPDEGGEIRIALRSPAFENAVQVRARAIRMPDRILLILDNSGAPNPRDDLGMLRERVSQLERLAATDHLTGAWNRAHFDRLISAELARSMASRQPVSLVLLDIDHFKRVNDTYGHSVGDSVLRELVRVVQSRIRASDFLFRWGGEEFAVLAATKGYRGAERLAENLRAAVAGQDFRGVGTVTISLGVAEHRGSEDPEAWFKRLDEALYSAKEGGRDRVVVDRRGNSDEWAGEPGVSALHLDWQEAYECGQPTIDEEHRELFVLANRLIDAASHSETDPATFRSSLDVLLGHVGRHFAAEEAILAQYHYTDLEQHQRAHAGLLRRAGFLRARAEAGEASLGSIVEFLAQDVVARHLIAVDRAFFPLFEKSTPAPVPRAAR